MESVSFFPGGEIPAKWRESNTALGRLVRTHRSGLPAAIRAASRVRKRLQKLFPVMDSLCKGICSDCRNRCCIRNRVWFDFQDLLFLHLLCLPVPPGPASGGAGRPCRYLARKGCLLPRLLRPFSCTLYLCPALDRRLGRRPRIEREAVARGIEAIRRERHAMESAFTRAVCAEGLA